MIRQRFALAALALVLGAAPAAAAGTTALVVRLGADTVSVERSTIDAKRLEIWQVGRAPRVLRRHFTYDLEKGAVRRMKMVVTPPGSDVPTQTVEVEVGADSIRSRVVSGSNPAQLSALAAPAGAVVVGLSSPWASYESVVARLVKGKADSLRVPLVILGASGLNWLTVEKLGRDSVVIRTDRSDRWHARVDKAGRVLAARPLSGTNKVSLERVAKLDLELLAANFAEREKAGTGVGTLSPRDSVVTSIGGAALWVDYGRPAKRGRVVFPDVVPFGELWRTGANAATQLRTDKALDFGGTVIPAGTYTLWTIPGRDGWKLLFNSQVGQWGTTHDAAKDVATVAMAVSALPVAVERLTLSIVPAGNGGELRLEWDTTRASAAFTVQP